MPSEKILEQKKQIVSDLADKMQKAVAGVMVDYRGLTVEEDTKLRNELRKADVEYAVVKNTLTRFAANQIGYTEFDEVLNGPTALALSYTDVVAPAKVLVEFAKKNENLELKAGFVEGKSVSIDELKTLAATPNFETLISKMMGSMQSPISGLARLLSTIVDGGVEISDLVAQKAADAPAEATAEEAAPAEEAPVAEAAAEENAEEAPAAE